MPVKETEDPRLQALFGASDPRDFDVRPTVRLPHKGLPPIILAGIALLLGVLLFSVLNSRRARQAEPAVSPRAADGPASAWVAPPPLYIPPVAEPIATPQRRVGKESLPSVAPPAAAPTPASRPAPAPMSEAAPQGLAVPAPAPPQIHQRSSGSPLVIDTGEAGSSASPLQTTVNSRVGGEAVQGAIRVRASAFANRSMTVPQGYLIPAVLETGFDSTKPGFARAIVSRDVRGFDGKNVLIPRGSRLIGDYQSAAGQGQNRAVITWTRLIRPDGMTIALDSPAVDTVGRGGVAASVNSHFFARLGNALLQSSFAIGQALSGRAVTGPVVVLQGSSANAATQLAPPPANLAPTLKIHPGKSISIFVARDLDFSAAGAAS
jgi:type IV secretion system protein VirB10